MLIHSPSNGGYSTISGGKDPLKLILQVHDELVLEGPLEEIERYKPQLMKFMTRVANLSVPLKVTTAIGTCWDFSD